MKLVAAILSVACLSSFHPVVLPILSGNHLQMVEQQTLNHLVELVLALNTTDHIPKNIGELSHPQLTSCVTSVQRHLVKNCVSKATCIHISGNPVDCNQMNNTAPEAVEDEEDQISPEMVHEIAELLFPLVMECVVEGISQMGMAGLTNITFLKRGIIEISSLSESQKISASAELESCFESNLTIPQVGGIDELSKIPEKVNKNNVAIALKAMVCSGKSMIQNGCYESKIPIN